jgi:hypothetical protein
MISRKYTYNNIPNINMFKLVPRIFFPKEKERKIYVWEIDNFVIKSVNVILGDFSFVKIFLIKQLSCYHDNYF